MWAAPQGFVPVTVTETVSPTTMDRGETLTPVTVPARAVPAVNPNRTHSPSVARSRLLIPILYRSRGISKLGRGTRLWLAVRDPAIHESTNSPIHELLSQPVERRPHRLVELGARA